MVLDIIIVLWVILDMIDGFRKGFILVTFSIASIFIGIYLADRFSGFTAGLLNLSNPYAEYIALAVTFCAAIAAVMVVAHLISRLIRGIGLGLLNSFGGALMGVARSVIVLGLLCMLLRWVNKDYRFIKEDYLETSRFYQPLLATADTLFPYLSELKIDEKIRDMVFPSDPAEETTIMDALNDAE